MSSATDIWRLPGPASYVDEVIRTLRTGQHVVAVLPEYLAADTERGEALAVALLDRTQQGERVRPWASDGPLVEAIGRQLLFHGDPPVTVPGLVRHPDLHGTTVVCLVSDLEPNHGGEIPEFLRRLEIESRSISADERCSFVMITGRKSLPTFAGNERADVTLANCWYWNRVSRWDIAAHLAARLGGTGAVGIIREVQTEMIIEIARWDFDLAVRLGESWSGDHGDLYDLCAEDASSPPPVSTSALLGTRPADQLIDSWEQGVVDGWHESICIAPSRRLESRIDLDRYAWAGQARVLLPWIEVNRDRLETLTRAAMGGERFEQAVRDFATDGEGRPVAEDIVEIGLLRRVIVARLGASEPRLRNAAQALWHARNRLSHLRPVKPARLDELVRVCSCLRP